MNTFIFLFLVRPVLDRDEMCVLNRITLNKSVCSSSFFSRNNDPCIVDFPIKGFPFTGQPWYIKAFSCGNVRRYRMCSVTAQLETKTRARVFLERLAEERKE